ncbi:MAG: nitrate- and nitrite sensing domain-containing protein, partial [Actinobacteria bacterium]|nr:nitrate- and nitrite sensing domain-containing protein [Actinomycetota bacterium]
MTALSFGGAPGVAVLGGDLSQLRRRGGRWRLRDWRLRTKLTAVLLMPLVLAGVLGALRVADSLRDVDRLDTLARQVSVVQGVGALVHDLQGERHLTVTKILAPATVDLAALPAQQARVDRGISALRSVESGAPDLGPTAAPAYQAAWDRLADITDLRADLSAPAPGATGSDADGSDADGSDAAVDEAVTGYTELTAVLLNLNRVVVGGAGDPLASHVDNLGALAVAKEQVSRQHAVLLAAMLSGALSAEQQGSLRTADARFDAAIAEFGEGTSPEYKQRYVTTVTGDEVAERDRLLDTALSGALQNAPLEIVPTNWDLAAADTVERIRQVESALLDQLLTDIGTAGGQAWNDAIRDAVVIAVLMILAVLLLVVVVRSLLRPLRTLRTHA